MPSTSRPKYICSHSVLFLVISLMKNNNIISNRFNFLGNVNLPLQFQGDLCLQLTFILMDPALLLVVKVNII